MDQLRHLLATNTATTEPYTYPRKGGSGEFKTPPRDDRVQHSANLVNQIQSAEQEAKDEAAKKPEEAKPKGTTLEFTSDPGFKLRLRSLESQRSGIELCNSRVDEQGVMHATVFVPDGKMKLFVNQFEKYATENTPKGNPRNKDFAESVTEIRRAALQSFWTDVGAFPDGDGEA